MQQKSLFLTYNVQNHETRIKNNNENKTEQYQQCRLIDDKA